MVETSMQTMDPKQSYNGFSQSMSESSNESALSQRRIEFHPVRKPIKGFSNGCGDFKLDTLNFSSSDSCLQVSNSVQSVFRGKKTDGSENFDSGLDPELSFGITFRRIGAGLYNLGNTCFLNSVLQCLTYTEPFAAYLQSGKHQNSCHIVGFCALCALQKHVSRALQSTGTSLSPDDLVRNLQCISRNFRNSRQEDAHEYMVNLLECMHRCCLPSGVHSESPSAYEKSLVHKIFGGRLRSQVKCLQCSHCSNTYDSFLDLSLEIVKADSLNRALANFTAAEQLDGGEKQYQCQLCREKVCALKQLTVDKPPYVLTIHLKRFHAYDPGQKIDKKIMFGPTLDLKPFVSESYEGGLKYTLYGVLVHYGWSTHSGHYSCFVHTSSGVWYSLDDNQVVQVSEKIVLEQKAYMLFYVRDRRNISSKKPGNVIQKENLRPNNNGARIYSGYKLDLTRQTQNGPVEDRSTGTASSAAIRLDELDISLAKTPHPNEASSHPMQEPPLEASLSKDSLKGVSPSSNIVENPPPSNNCDASSLKKDTTSVTGCNANNFDEKEVSTKKCGVLLATSSLDSEEPQRSVKCLRDQISNKNCSISPVEDYCVASPQDTCGIESQKIDYIKPLSQQRCEKIQVETVSHESAAGKPLGENAGDSSQNLVNDDSINLSGSSNTLGFLNVKASDCKSPKKLKKVVLKFHATRGILFRQSLSIRKKKKHKKSKNRPLDTKNLSIKCLMDTKCFPSDLGPSTSENTHKAPLDCTRSKQKRVQCVSKKEANGTVAKEVNAQSDSSNNVVDGEFRQRIYRNGSVLATCDQPQNNSGSADHRNAKEAGNLQMYDTDRIQNRFVGMLTRGLEETVELPSQIVESTAVVENIHIGYVADERDEEYDLGKRKKLRQSKHNFGGPNPFQEIATRKMKLKKAKRDGSNYGNQPFRI